jgi:hypothetical protein
VSILYTGGKKVARSTFNRRQQNTTNAMKKRFQGE